MNGDRRKYAERWLNEAVGGVQEEADYWRRHAEQIDLADTDEEDEE